MKMRGDKRGSYGEDQDTAEDARHGDKYPSAEHDKEESFLFPWDLGFPNHLCGYDVRLESSLMDVWDTRICECTYRERNRH